MRRGKGFKKKARENETDGAAPRRPWRLSENNRAFDLAIFQSTGQMNPHPRQAAADAAAAMAAAATAVIKTTWFKYLTKKRAWQRLADWFERRAADKAAAVEAAAATEATAQEALAQAEAAAQAEAEAQAEATATAGGAVIPKPANWSAKSKSQRQNWYKRNGENGRPSVFTFTPTP